MKTFVIIALLFPVVLFGQVIKVIDLETNDIVFNPNDNKIYATTPSTAGTTYGNSICIINPITAEIEDAFFIGSEPNKIALSDNGQTMYVALDGAASVRYFNVLTRTPGLQFQIRTDPSFNPLYVDDMHVLPGKDSSLIISRKNVLGSPRHQGVAVYDWGVMRVDRTPGHIGSNVIEFISNDRLVGISNESSSGGLRMLQVDSNGVEEIGLFGNFNLNSGFSSDIYHSDGRIYSTNGRVIDVTSQTPTLTATFFEASGPVVESPDQNLICYAYQEFWDDAVFLKRYSKNQFVIVDTIVISDALTQGDVSSLISWGKNGELAFNTSEGKVVIIGGPALTSSDPPIAAPDFQLYPNPTRDMIMLSCRDQSQALEIQLSTLAGEIIQTLSSINVPYSIDLSNYPAGSYLLHIQSEQGSSVRKIIKY